MQPKSVSASSTAKISYLAKSEFSPFPERSIRTHEDWHAYATKSVPVKPIMPTRAAFDSMSSVERRAFNQTRRVYQEGFAPLLVPDMEEIHEAALRLARQNLRAQPGARPGLIMDGISTVGKSTIAMQLGRRYEKLLTKNHTITRTPTGNVFLPVAFVNLPGEVSIMNFNYLLARFYNIPFSKKVKEGDLTDRIKEHAADCGTSMVILDDIHFLRIKNRSHETVNNHFKHLANSISATFVYAGINVEGSGLLSEGNKPENKILSQTAHRFKRFELLPFDYNQAKSREDFLKVLTSFEDNLLLFEQTKGSLVSVTAEYIWDRTGGFIGPMSALIREGAALAIKRNTERITIKLLKDIKLDFDSEQQFKLCGKKYQASGQKSTE
jgi:hypothetical protein